METLGEGVSHVSEGTEWGGERFQHADQNGVLFKIYDLFISGLFLKCLWTTVDHW